jgi:hypothetical protein
MPRIFPSTTKITKIGGMAMNFLRRLWHGLTGACYCGGMAADGPRPALGYLCLLVFAAIIIMAPVQYRRIDKTITALALETRNMPDFELEKGRFRFAGRMPYIAGDRNLAFIIDTTGATDARVFTGYKSGVLITATHCFIKSPDWPLGNVPLADLPFGASRKKVTLSLPGFIGPLFALDMAYLLFRNLFAKLLTAALVGLALWLAFGRRGMTYIQAASATIYALTVPLLLSLGGNLHPWQYWGLTLILAGAAVFHGAKTNAFTAPLTAAASSEEDDGEEMELI